MHLSVYYSATSIVSTVTGMEHASKPIQTNTGQEIITVDQSINKQPGKTLESTHRHHIPKSFRLSRFFIFRKQPFKLVNLLPSVTVIQFFIVVLFCVNFWCFYLSLGTVTIQENQIHKLETKQNRYFVLENQFSIASVILTDGQSEPNNKEQSENQKNILHLSIELTQIKKQSNKSNANFFFCFTIL